jgi:D-3-phosphoglycerate dehydrogenase / 2-oxoglutarate reductase
VTGEPARILVTWPGYDPLDPETGARLVAAGYEVDLQPKLGARSPEDLSSLLGDAVGAIVSTDPFTRDVIAAAARLRVIARVGVGTDSIDLAAASEHGIAIAITPGQNAETVADHALALILALVRKIAIQDRAVRDGRWERVGAMAPGELFGRTVGLIGAGEIGRAVIRRLQGFGVEIVAYDPAVASLPGVEVLSSVDDLFRRADIVSLHAPLLPATRHIVNAARLGLMKPTSVIVNTARGGLIDQPALLQALRRRQIAGAALDVFEAEPPDAGEFADLDNVVLSPHLAGLSHESIRRMTVMATDSVLRVLRGEMPGTVINREACLSQAESGSSNSRRLPKGSST